MGYTNRNVGIEVVRIVSMFMVMVLHVLLNGGVLNVVDDAKNFNYLVAWSLELICIIAVNLFGLVSGYLLIKSHFKIKRVVELWIQVFSYSVVITLLTAAFTKPGTFDIVESFFPILFKRYWYYSAYLVLYIMMPALNVYLKLLSKKKFRNLLTLITILFSFVATVARPDNIFLFSGYSPLWLICLYIFGAYFRLFGFPKYSLKILFSSYLLLNAVNISIFLIPFIPKHILMDLVLAYTNPLNLALAVNLFIILVRKQNYGWFVTKTSLKLGSLSFAAYLVQTNPSLFLLFKNKFSFLGNLNSLIMIVCVLLCGALFLLTGMFMEYIRLKIVNTRLGAKIIDTITDKVEKTIDFLSFVSRRFI